MYRYLWYFVIYSFLGWCLEVTYKSFEEKRFINRGFLNGPYCPIYGFSSVCLIYCLSDFLDRPIRLFLVAIVLTSFIEFLTGYILEKIFKLQWWDYTTEFLNIKGYICIKFSFYWGIASLILLYIIQPKICIIVDNIVQFSIILHFILALMLYDFIISIMQIIKLKQDIKFLNRLIKDRLEKRYERLLTSFPKLKKLIDKIEKPLK